MILVDYKSFCPLSRSSYLCCFLLNFKIIKNYYLVVSLSFVGCRLLQFSLRTSGHFQWKAHVLFFKFIQRFRFLLYFCSSSLIFISWLLVLLVKLCICCPSTQLFPVALLISPPSHGLVLIQIKLYINWIIKCSNTTQITLCCSKEGRSRDDKHSSPNTPMATTRAPYIPDPSTIPGVVRSSEQRSVPFYSFCLWSLYFHLRWYFRSRTVG